jgi:hypothetical protein
VWEKNFDDRLARRIRVIMINKVFIKVIEPFTEPASIEAGKSQY